MNTYRKGIVVGFALLALLVGPLSARAVSIGDLQAQVQSLLAQIAGLQGSANSGSTVSTAVPAASYRACSLVWRNLGYGSRGDDVTALQELLQSRGYLSGSATGYFGPMTVAAVARWQGAEGVSAVGAFGPSSREHLKVWCGNQVESAGVPFTATPSQGNAPLVVTFNTWLSGFRLASTYYTIDFGDGTTERAADCYAPADACMSAGQNVHTYAQNGSYTATLNRITDPCAGNVACRAAIHMDVVAKTQITVGSATVACKPINYMAIACSDGSAAQAQHNESGCIIGYECPVANYAPPVSCKAWNDGCSECGRTTPGGVGACTQRACFAAGKGFCSVYFDGASTSNRPPVVSGLSGPSTLTVNQTGTWSVTASDPENGQLSYQITWGDEYQGGVTTNMSLVAQAANQNSSFTHSYAVGGTYTITIVVTDNAGQQAKTSTTVLVGSGTLCTQQYQPVCGRPTGCANAGQCPAGMACPMYCQMPSPQTYGNTCALNAAGAQYLYTGACVPGGPQY